MMMERKTNPRHQSHTRSKALKFIMIATRTSHSHSRPSCPQAVVFLASEADNLTVSERMRDKFSS